jgi:hypothetical protein
VVILVDADVEDPEHPNDEKDRFMVSVCSKEGVPKFGPPTPEGYVFKRNQDLRAFILKKRKTLLIINYLLLFLLFTIYLLFIYY